MMVLKHVFTYFPSNYPRLLAIFGFITLLFVNNPVYSKSDESSESADFLYENDIKFEGSSVHIDMNYFYLLESLVEYLENNPNLNIHIRGHVCCRPGQRISRRRARNVYRYLKNRGISKQRMTHAGYSNSIPLASPERTSEDERINRRVDFVLSGAPANSK